MSSMTSLKAEMTSFCGHKLLETAGIWWAGLKRLGIVIGCIITAGIEYMNHLYSSIEEKTVWRISWVFQWVAASSAGRRMCLKLWPKSRLSLLLHVYKESVAPSRRITPVFLWWVPWWCWFLTPTGGRKGWVMKCF